MSRTLTVISCVVIFITLTGVLVWFWSRSSDPSNVEPLSEAPMETFVVRYDGLSFQPRTIKVPRGTEVFFTNESTQPRPMYIASNDHPTHGNYPGFDAAAVNNKFPAMGESFSFLFEKPGTWGYHDHNFATAQGIIIVE